MYGEIGFNISMYLENKRFRNLFEIYKITEKIAKNMLFVNPELGRSIEFETIGFSQTEAMFQSFLNSLGKEFASDYLNILRFDANRVHFVSEQSENDASSKVEEDGTTTIVLDGTIKDLFKMVHELTHCIYYQNFPVNKRPNNFDFLVEVNSITMELLLYEFLIQNGYYTPDVCKFMNDRFRLFESYNGCFLFEMMLSRIVEKHKTLSKKLLNKYIDQAEDELKPYFRYYRDNLKDIITYGFSFPTLNRYISAILFACHLKKQIIEDRGQISLLFRIGKDIYSDDLYDALNSGTINYLEKEIKKMFGFFTKECFVINDEKTQELLDDYFSEFGVLQDRLRNEIVGKSY